MNDGFEKDHYNNCALYIVDHQTKKRANTKKKNTVETSKAKQTNKQTRKLKRNISLHFPPYVQIVMWSSRSFGQVRGLVAGVIIGLLLALLLATLTSKKIGYVKEEPLTSHYHHGKNNLLRLSSTAQCKLLFNSSSKKIV